jgi:hypothetical protein
VQKLPGKSGEPLSIVIELKADTQIIAIISIKLLLKVAAKLSCQNLSVKLLAEAPVKGHQGIRLYCCLLKLLETLYDPEFIRPQLKRIGCNRLAVLQCRGDKMMLAFRRQSYRQIPVGQIISLAATVEASFFIQISTQ